MRSKGPGKHYREGMTLVDLMDLFPDEQAATRWFEDVCWNGQRCCGKCGSTKTREVPNAKPMPYWCSDCRSYFSVRTGTLIARSNVPLRKWAIAIYLCLTSLKSVSSMKLHRDIGVSQRTAWFMLHRIREAWATEGGDDFTGPVEVDESYFGGKRRNMSNAQREALHAADVGPGVVGKTAVAGMKDRATNRVSAAVVPDTNGPTLHGFVREAHAARRAGLHGRSARLPWTPLPPSRPAFSRRIRQRRGPHQRRRSVLECAKARTQGHVPQDQPEALEPLRERIRREAQPTGARHPRPNARHRGATGWAATPLPRPHR